MDITDISGIYYSTLGQFLWLIVMPVGFRCMVFIMLEDSLSVLMHMYIKTHRLEILFSYSLVSSLKYYIE